MKVVAWLLVALNRNVLAFPESFTNLIVTWWNDTKMKAVEWVLVAPNRKCPLLNILFGGICIIVVSCHSWKHGITSIFLFRSVPSSALSATWSHCWVIKVFPEQTMFLSAFVCNDNKKKSESINLFITASINFYMFGSLRKRLLSNSLIKIDWIENENMYYFDVRVTPFCMILMYM